jgi:hypothetical protein
MIVQVDLRPRPPVVALEEPDDTGHFHVVVIGGDDRALVYGALVDAAAGRLDGDDAWITLDAVRRWAAGRVGPTWDDDLARMVEYARTKGWVDDSAYSVRAHVEWPA